MIYSLKVEQSPNTSTYITNYTDPKRNNANGEKWLARGISAIMVSIK